MADDAVGKSVLEVGADGSQFETAVNGMTRAATDMEKRVVGAATNASEAVGRVGGAAGKSTAQQEAASRRYLASLEREVNQLTLTRAEYRKLEAQKLGISESAYAPLIKRLDEATAAQGRFVKGAAGAAMATRDMRVEANLTKNALRQLPAQFTDIFVSLQGGMNPMTVLIQQGGQIKDMFGGVGQALRAMYAYIGPTYLALGGLAAVAGATYAAFRQGAEEGERYRRVIALTGNAAGTTSLQLEEQARAIASNVGTQGKAAEVLAQFAETGRVASVGLGAAAEAAIRLERVGGPAVEKMVSAFAAIGKDPLRASLQLNESLGFMTIALYDQIRALEEQGKTAEAARLAQAAASDFAIRASKELESNLNSLSRTWRDVSDTAKAAWDQFAGIGRDQTTGDRLAEIQRNLALLDKAGQNRFALFGPSRDELLNEQRSINSSLLRQAEQNASQGAMRQLIEDYDKALKANQKWADAALTNTQKIDRALTEYRNNLAKINEGLAAKGQGPISDDVVRRQEEAIRKSFAGASAKSGSGRDAFGPMIRDIEDLIRANDTRIEQNRELTKSEELAIRLNNRLADSLKDLTAPQQALVRSAIDRAIASQRLRDAQVDELKAAEKLQKLIEKAAAVQDDAFKREDEEATKAAQRRLEAARSRVSSIRSELTAMATNAQAMALSRKQNIDLAAAIQLVTAARDEHALSFLQPGTEEHDALKREIELRKELAGVIESASIGKSIDDLLDPNRAQSFGEALTDAFDGAGNALARLGNAFADYARKQDELQKRIARNAKDESIDPEEKLRRQNRLIAAQGDLQIETYATMAGAAKGFFSENTRGYRAMQAAENAFRAYQLASDIVKGVSAAAVGIANQAQGDPYSAFPRMAAMAAAMAALGFATGFLGKSGDGANATAEQRQGGAATGRLVTADQAKAGAVLGTVLGDGEAKSKSIQNALDLIADSSDLALGYQSGMLQALLSIENSLAGLGSLVVRTSAGGLTTGRNLGIQTGTLRVNTGDPIANMLGIGGLAKIGWNDAPIIGPIIDKLQALWGKTTQKIVDTGLEISGTVADIMVRQFADVETTTSSFFGLKKDTDSSTVFGNQEDVKPLADQFKLIFEFIGSAVESSAEALGRDGGEALANAIASFPIAIERLSLKDLKGDELQEALNAAVGAAADELALAVIPGLGDFQNIGEGYFETLIKVASGIETANYELELLGITAIDYTAVLRKQADVAAEIVRQSIQGAETIGGALSSVGQLIAGVDGTAEQIADTYRDLIEVREGLIGVGIAGEALTVSLIRSSGGLGALGKSVQTYFDEFFTAEERMAVAATRLAADFTALGLSMPSTRDEFRSLVDGIDDTTASGQALLAKVLGLAGAFDEVSDAAERMAQDIVDAIAQVLPKFQTSQERTASSYQQIAVDLQAVGVNVDVAALLGASKEDIYQHARALVESADITDEARLAIIRAAGALADLKDSALSAEIALQNSLATNLGKFLSPQDRIDTGFETVARDLNVAGLFKDIPNLADILSGMSLQEVYAYAEAFAASGDNSTEAKIAIAGAAGALYDLAMAARDIERADIQKQLADIADRFGDVTVIDDVEKLSEAFVRNRDEMKGLEDGLDDLLGRTSKTIQEVLADLLQSQRALQQYRGGALADAIEKARLGTLSPEQRIEAMRRNEESLFRQIDTSDDPVAVAQRLQDVIIDRIRLEADLRGEGLRDELTALERIRDISKELAQFTGSLRSSDLSPLSFEQQLSESRALFEKTLEGAQAGDNDAIGNLIGNARAYLEEARAYFASGSGYSAIFNEVTGVLDAFGLMGSQTDPQIAALQALLDAVDDGSAETYAALQQIDGALAAREVVNNGLVNQQIALAQAQIEQQRTVVSELRAQIAQWAEIARGLNERLDTLNDSSSRIVRNNELANAGA